MSGRPDYDAGDLVECIDASPCRDSGLEVPVQLGAVYGVKSVVFLPTVSVWIAGWYADIAGLDAFIGAHRFRLIPPKPLEFWTGDVDADLPEQVPA